METGKLLFLSKLSLLVAKMAEWFTHSHLSHSLIDFALCLFETVSYSPACSLARCTAEDDLELILLPLLPKNWDYCIRHNARPFLPFSGLPYGLASSPTGSAPLLRG